MSLYRIEGVASILGTLVGSSGRCVSEIVPHRLE